VAVVLKYSASVRTSPVGVASSHFAPELTCRGIAHLLAPSMRKKSCVPLEPGPKEQGSITIAACILKASLKPAYFSDLKKC